MNTNTNTTVAEIVEYIEAETIIAGGEIKFLSRDNDQNLQTLSSTTVLARIAQAQSLGLVVSELETTDGRFMVDISNGKGSSYGQFVQA